MTDAKKRMNIQLGYGIVSLLTTAFNMIKPALPKIASTIGLRGLSTGISHGINKALKKILLLNWMKNKLMILIKILKK